MATTAALRKKVEAIPEEHRPASLVPNLDLMKNLDGEIRERLAALSPMKRKFVKAFRECRILGEAAARAGYAKRSAYSTGSRLMKIGEISTLVAMIDTRDQLEHGIDKGYKRALLAQVANLSATPGETYQPRSSVAAVNELNRMDGHHAPTNINHSGSVSVNIAYDLGAGRVIEADAIENDSGSDRKALNGAVEHLTE